MFTDADNTNPAVFFAVADPARRAILEHLRGGALSAGELASRFSVSRPAVSRHVRVLRDAGLVRQTRDRQMLHYSLDPAPLALVDRWLSGYRVFWGARMQELRQYVEEEQSDE